MNYDHFSVITSLNENSLVIEFGNDMILDETAMKVIANDKPDFILPVKRVEVNGAVTLKYKLSSGISLEYCKMPMTKKIFSNMYQQLLRPFIEGKNWFLDYHYFCLNPLYIYMDKNLSKVDYVYIPEKSYYNSDEEIFEFFRSILNSAEVTDDSGVLLRLFQYFGRGHVTLGELYKIVSEEKTDTTAGSAMVSNPVVSVSNTQMPQQSVQTANIQQAIKTYLDPIVSNVKQSSIPNPLQSTDNAKEEQPAVKPAKAGLLGGILGGKTEDKPDQKKSLDFLNFGKEQEVKPVASSFQADNNDSDEAIVNALFGSGNKTKDKNKEKKEKSQEGGRFAGIFGGSKKNNTEPVLSVSNPLLQQIPQQMSQQTPINVVKETVPVVSGPVFNPINIDDTEVTVTDDMDIFGNVACLRLISSEIPGAPERILLNQGKPAFNIGRASKDAIQADVKFPTEFKMVGRMHLRILVENGRYYAVDLGAQNHTSYNGRQLSANEKVELKSGGELVFVPNHPVKYRVEI